MKNPQPQGETKGKKWRDGAKAPPPFKNPIELTDDRLLAPGTIHNAQKKPSLLPPIDHEKSFERRNLG